MVESPEISAASLLKRRLLAGGAWALGGRFLLALAGLILTALLGRLLSPQDLGTFFLAFSVASVLAVLGSIGLSTTVVRLVAEDLGRDRPGRARTVIRKALTLAVVGTSTVGTMYLFLGGPLVANLFDDPALAAVTGLVSGWILALTLQSFLAETFRGFHDIRLAAIFGRSAAGLGSLLSGALLIAALATLRVSGVRPDLKTVMLLTVGCGFVSVVLAGWLLKQKLETLQVDEQSKNDESTFARLLGMTWPLLVADLTLLMLTQADIWIVGAFRPQADVALYGAAARLVTLLIMPLLIVNAVMPPLIAENYAQGKTLLLQRLLRVTATLAGIPAVIVLLSFLLFGEQILAAVFGAYYGDGAAVLAMLSLGQLASVFTGSCGVTLAMTGHQTLMMVITVISGSLTVAAGLLAVVPYGILGVAGATACGLVLQNVLLWSGVRYKTGLQTHMAIRGLPGMVRALRAN